MSTRLGPASTTRARWGNQRLGSPPWVAYTEHAYVELLLARGRPDDVLRARDLATFALALPSAWAWRVEYGCHMS